MTVDMTAPDDVDWIARARDDPPEESKADWTEEEGPRGGTRWVSSEGDVRYRRPAGAGDPDEEIGEGATRASDLEEGDRVVIDGEEAEVSTLKDMGGGFYVSGRTDSDEVVTARVGPDEAFDDADGPEAPSVEEGGDDPIADATEDELIDAMLEAASGNPADEGAIAVAVDHADGREGLVDAIGDMDPGLRGEIEAELEGGSDGGLVDEVVPEAPDDTIRAWEEQHGDEIASGAAAHGMQPDEYREELADEYGRVMDNAQAAIRAPPGVIPDILDSGRFKNQHETGTSGGWLDSDGRREFEEGYMGVPDDRDDSEMPVYGFASAEGAETSDEPDDLAGYGSASIRLSDEAKESATVTFGDSYSANGGMGGGDDLSHAATPANDPGEESLDVGNIPIGHDADTQLELLRGADDPTDLEMYNEMQFHGGVGADEIEEVKFDATADFMDPPSDEILGRLDDAGIDYEVET